MTSHRVAPALKQLRSLVAVHGSRSRSDGELLERFVHHEDEAAFSTLVRRHGPLVFRICRRVLQDWHASEDAFQATFLVLARRAGSIRKHQALSSWLHGVAMRIALKARCRASKPAPPPTERQSDEPAADVTLRELRRVLDDELQRLPDRYAAPLVLCYLEGKTRDEAAQQLGWPMGTFNSRLDRGRALLRPRLQRRGLELAAVLGAVCLAERSEAAALAAGLVERTVRASMEFAAGQPISQASARAAALAEGMRTTIVTMHWKLVTVAVLFAGLLGTGTSVWLRDAALAQAPAKANEPPAAAAPAPAAPRIDNSGDPLPADVLARIGSLRWRHGAAITFVSYALDGKAVISASKDGTIRVWNLQNGEELHRFGKLQRGDDEPDPGIMMPLPALLGGGGVAPVVALAPDGKTLAFAFPDAGAGLLNLMLGDGKDGKKPRVPGTPIEVWDLAARKRLHKIEGDGGSVGSLAFSPDGKLLATRAADEAVRVFDMAAGKETYRLTHKRNKTEGVVPDQAPGLVFTPDGKLLITGERDLVNQQPQWSVRIWDLQTRKELAKIDTADNTLRSMAIAPDGTLLAYAEQGAVQLREPRSGKKVRALDVASARSLVFSPDSKQLVCRGFDDAIQVFDVATGNRLRKFGAPARDTVGLKVIFGGFGNPAPTLAFSADGKTLLAGEQGNCVGFWDVATGKDLPRVTGHTAPLLALVLSADGKTLVSAATDGTLRRWDAVTGKELGQVHVPEKVTYIALAPDGRTAALGTAGKAIRLHDLVADKEIRVLEGHTTGSLVLAFSSDGKRLASRGAVEKQLRVYDVASGKLLHEIALPTKEGAGVVIGPRQRVCLGFSPDGQLLATPGPDNSLSIFHERSGKEIRRLPIKQAAASFAFSSDNRLVAVEDADCTVTLWEVASGTRRATLGKAHKVQTGFSMMINGGFLPETPGDGAASALAFSPDGRLLAARGSDQAIVLYDAAGGQELGQCKGHQGNITALAFAGDGRALATGSADTTALIWDLATARRKLQPVRRELTDAELPAFWDDLAARNGAKAYNAVQRLTAAPAQAVAFLKGQLRPAAPVDSQRIDALLADLASPQFAVRQKATEELEKIGELAEGALQKALEAQPGLELRQRIEHLLDQLVSNKPPADDRIRLIRALEVLERIGTPDARAILDKLAQGASPAYQTREARAVLERLGK